ncbi:MAG: MaoC family dehydratase N-terminal domain-containing protein [Rhodospirillales bacterium]|nr:MaoC family dehydratase N-terminal domain-containing protein [Rhodospirillales bacterium]
MADAIEEYEKFIGLTTTTEDLISASQVQRLAVTLNRDDPMPKIGDAVPPGWQSIFFPRLNKTKNLSRDGMASDMENGPPSPLPRRMYAGNNMRFHQPFRIGDAVTKEMAISSVTPKEGRSGKLVFVTIGVKISGPNGLVMEDDQNLVYREEEEAGAKPPPGEPGPSDAPWKREVIVDPVMLFRFSACTFNPHRIHYDHPYVTGVENYPGLIVHGPFTAVWLLELARDFAPDKTLATFNMQARAPIYADQPFTLMGEPSADGASCQLWAVNKDGMIAMKASADFA